MAFEGNTWWTYMIFSIIAITALLGNGLVIYVLVTRSVYLRQPYNIFIFNLATTDICTALFLIVGRYLYLPSATGSNLARLLYCKFMWSAWVPFTLGYISIYTCTALTMERWLAVCKPMLYRQINRGLVVRCIVAVWVWGVAINVTTFFRIDYGHNQCSWRQLAVGNDIFPWVDFTLQSVAPFTAMLVLYSQILYKMRRLATTSANIPLKKVTKIAFAASFAIIVGWLPSRISFALSKLGFVDPGSLFHFCLVVLAFANSCINPFLYGIYSSQFRNEYRLIFKKMFKVRRPLRQTRAPPASQPTSQQPTSQQPTTPAISHVSRATSGVTTRF